MRDGYRFTIVEYIEFSTADEFKKFRHFPPITVKDCLLCDIDKLALKLQEGKE